LSNQANGFSASPLFGFFPVAARAQLGLSSIWPEVTEKKAKKRTGELIKIND